LLLPAAARQQFGRGFSVQKKIPDPHQPPFGHEQLNIGQHMCRRAVGETAEVMQRRQMPSGLAAELFHGLFQRRICGRKVHLVAGQAHDAGIGHDPLLPDEPGDGMLEDFRWQIVGCSLPDFLTRQVGLAGPFPVEHFERHSDVLTELVKGRLCDQTPGRAKEDTLRGAAGKGFQFGIAVAGQAGQLRKGQS
jgi:hypothetical protein